MQVNGTEIVIALVGLVFSAVILPLVRAAFMWLKSKTKNEALSAALEEAQVVADGVVAGLQANVVDGLKGKSEDGKLDADDVREIADMAVDEFIRDLSARSLAVIEENADDLIAYIGNMIEARLAKAKK